MTHKIRTLTGITTTGTPHLGNYVGAIRPAIQASRREDVESFYFLADYHALIKCDEPSRVARSRLEIAATWLALGLDTERAFFYCQSDVPETTELTWLLTCVTAKGLLNRAHAYKASVDKNSADGEDADAGINAGLYMYPVLMAADILIFNAQRVPVGRDQIQHIEMARDIGQRFNHLYGASWRQATGASGDPFVLPEAAIEDDVSTLPGLDGRKMSKSYNNTIPLWLPEADLRKAILGIVTDSRAPGEPKETADSNLFSIYQAFASAAQTAEMREAFAAGIGWGEVKQKLYECINSELAPARERYNQLIRQPDQIEAVLQTGAAKARQRSQLLMAGLRKAVGLGPLHSAEAVAAAPRRAPAAPQMKTYRESDGHFHIKLTWADDTLLRSRGFASPQDAGRLLSALVEAGDGFDPLGGDVAGDVILDADVTRVRDALASLKQAKLDKLQSAG